ncbi:MAG: hypothetical protein IK077_04685 [Thermoguttaceae bacterium]|nr:hypothetical protein [Thermoguttaceae bacterium]
MPETSIISEVQNVTGMSELLSKQLALTLSTLASQSDNPSIRDIVKDESERVAISRFSDRFIGINALCRLHVILNLNVGNTFMEFKLRLIRFELILR